MEKARCSSETAVSTGETSTVIKFTVWESTTGTKRSSTMGSGSTIRCVERVS